AHQLLSHRVDSICGNSVAWETLTGKGIIWLCCRLRKIAVAFQRGRLPVSCEIRGSHSKSAACIRNEAQRLVKGVKEEQLFTIRIDSFERNRSAYCRPERVEPI